VPKYRPRLGPFALFGIFLLLWVLIPTSWKIITKSAFTEFHAPFWEAHSRISDLSDYWGHQADSKKTLILKNRDLVRILSNSDLQKGLNENWQKEVAKIRGLKSQLSALESTIGIDSITSFDPMLARITHRSINGWWQGFSVRKGHQHGLSVGYGAICSGGIVGRLHQVHSRSAEIQLASNPSFRIVASFAGDDRPVTFQGSGYLPGGRPRGIVFDVPHDLTTSSERPLFLVTSSLGGTFPTGLPIGKVEKLKESGDGLFKTGEVILPSTLGRLSEITLLVPSSE